MKKNQQSLSFLHLREEEEPLCPLFFFGKKSESHENRFSFFFQEKEETDGTSPEA